MESSIYEFELKIIREVLTQSDHVISNMYIYMKPVLVLYLIAFDHTQTREIEFRNCAKSR